MHAILPAAGRATRMRGLPKFLLPTNDACLTLVEWHTRAMLEVAEVVWIPVRTDSFSLLESLGIFGSRVIPLVVETETMTETVLEVISVSGADNFIFGMPDTYFWSVGAAYDSLSSHEANVVAGLFPIRDEQKGKVGQVKLMSDSLLIEKVVDKDQHCDYSLLWGCLKFNRELAGSFLPKDPHVGYGLARYVAEGHGVEGLEFDGLYFDCGTPSEYWSLLSHLVNT